MTSNDSSYPSPRTNGQGPMTYERLRNEPARLRKLVWVLGSQAWEDLEVWFQAERQAHLEASVEADDPGEREGHRIIARWLKHFLSIAKEALIDLEHSERNPVPEGDPEYMEYDSDSNPEGSNGSSRVPSGTS